MPKKPHKHRDIIIAWADGENIQYKLCKKWIDVEWAPSWDEETEYRIKPEVIRYRVGLFKDGIEAAENTRQESNWQSTENFVKWLTDWIEVEV